MSLISAYLEQHVRKCSSVSTSFPVQWGHTASRRDRITTLGVHYFSYNSTVRHQLFLTYSIQQQGEFMHFMYLLCSVFLCDIKVA